MEELKILKGITLATGLEKLTAALEKDGYAVEKVGGGYVGYSNDYVPKKYILMEKENEIPLILEGVTYYGGEGSVAHWVNQNYPVQTPLWDINDKKIIHLDEKFLQKYKMEMKEIRWLC